MTETNGNPEIVRTRAAAGVLLFDERGHVMLVEPAGRDDKFLGIPGGYVEPGETPRETAARKVREELGVEFPVGRLLVVDWAPAHDGEKIVFVFEGPLLASADLARIRLTPTSLAGFAFHDPATTADLLMTRLVRRIEAAVPARAARATVYLEHGEPLLLTAAN